MSAENSGGTLGNVTVGDTLRIVLEADDPGSGTTWETDKLDTALLGLVGEPIFEPGDPSQAGAGTTTLDFQALKEGKTLLRLIYHKAGDQSTPPPAQIFEITLVIQPSLSK